MVRLLMKIGFILRLIQFDAMWLTRHWLKRLDLTPNIAAERVYNRNGNEEVNMHRKQLSTDFTQFGSSPEINEGVSVISMLTF